MKLLGIFAHPDDEVVVSGLVQRYISDGFEVEMICATKGEAGSVRNKKANYDAHKDISAIREEEYKSSCAFLGVDKYHFLNVVDGDSKNWDTSDLVDKIEKIIEISLPTHIVSFDDNGGNGHPDHKMISKIARTVCARNTKVKLLQVTFPTRSFIEREFDFLPKEIKTKSISNLCIEDDFASKVLELNEIEYKNKMHLVKIYKGQFPDEENKYYNLPMSIFERISKSEFYHEKSFTL